MPWKRFLPKKVYVDQSRDGTLDLCVACRIQFHAPLNMLLATR